jgi:hypothetical protein
MRVETADSTSAPIAIVRRSGNLESISRSRAYAPKMHNGICQPAIKRRLMTRGR